MNFSDRHILQQRLDRLRLINPTGMVARKKLEREIMAIERKLTGQRKRGRPIGATKKKQRVNSIDWNKVAAAAAKL
jgi:hypothetical protein